MRQGIPGFVPQRLIEAREARDMTQVTLAQLIGKSSSTSIGRWERGEQLPEPLTVDALCRALSLPTAYFLRPMPQHGDGPFFFRSMVAATKAARQKARARLGWAQQIILILQEYLELPACDVPELMGNRDFRTLEDTDIERMATECRRYWGLGDGPISDIHLLMENHGIIIVHDEVGSGTMDGLSAWSKADNRAYIYVAVDKPSAVRARFNVAHELAHLILHKQVKQSKLATPEEFKEIERQAHLFAAAFLLPAQTFTAELPSSSLNGFLSLKERWKVSIGAMIKRADSLGLVEEDYLLRLWKHYSARGWRTREPLDDRLPTEQPRLPGRSIMTLADQGGWTVQQILSEIPFFANDIERLTSLPHGYLNDQLGQVVQMPRMMSPTSLPSGGAEILDFQAFNKRRV